MAGAMSLEAFAQGAPPSDQAAINARRDSGYVSLFNGKNFDGLYSIIRGEGRNETPDQGQKVFEIRNGMIFTQIGEGFVASKKRFSHYICRVEYKYGDRSSSKYHGGNPTWNSGFLYHIYNDEIWPRGMEYQLLRTDAGTIWTNPDERFRTTVAPGSKRFKPKSEGGVDYQTQGEGDRTIQKSAQFDKTGEWNVALIRVHKDTAWHYVNGKLNNFAYDIRYKNGANWDLIADGGVGVQAEFSEMYYHAWEILELDESGKPIKPSVSSLKPMARKNLLASSVLAPGMTKRLVLQKGRLSEWSPSRDITGRMGSLP